MLCELNTVKGGTQTTEGFIQHKKHSTGVYMPVKLDFVDMNIHSLVEYQKPLRDDEGNLIYALPCGNEFIETISFQRN